MKKLQIGRWRAGPRRDGATAFNLAAFFTGTEESIYAIWKAIESHGHRINCLISMPRATQHGAWLHHNPDIDLIKVQADALGLPLIELHLKDSLKPHELEAALKQAKINYGIEGITAGIFKEHGYEQKLLTDLCDVLKLRIVDPICKRDRVALLKELISAGFKIAIVQIDHSALDRSWIGLNLDRVVLDKLIELTCAGASLGSEGSYSFFVFDGPIYRQAIDFSECDVRMEGPHSGAIRVHKVKLIAKEAFLKRHVYWERQAGTHFFDKAFGLSRCKRAVRHKGRHAGRRG